MCVMFEGDDVTVKCVRCCVYISHRVRVCLGFVGRSLWFEVNIGSCESVCECECVGVCWLGECVDSVSLSVFHCSYRD